VAGLIAEGSETHSPGPVLYVSGEESVEQISSRADRLNIRSHDLFLFSATDLELVLEAIREVGPKAVILDSIQTVYLAEASGSAGSVSQVCNLSHANHA
jgi:DNA repair protein RadA/Sms